MSLGARVALVLSLLLVLGEAATAQLLTATGEFRVVQVDLAEKRLGVARPEAEVGVRQIWVYLREKTRVSQRISKADGSVIEQPSTLESALSSLRPGDMIKVHGGRDFDGSINAKSLQLLGTPHPVEIASPSRQDPSTPLANLNFPETKWNGVVTDVTSQGALLDVGDGQLVCLPANVSLLRDGAPVSLSDLTPGSIVAARIPKGSGTLVAATDDYVTLHTTSGLTQIATSSIAAKDRAGLMVPVLTQGGSSIQLPFKDALVMQKSEGASIVNSGFPVLSRLPAQAGTGVVLQTLGNFVMLATPNGQLYKVPRDGLVVSPAGGINFQAVNGKMRLQPGLASPGKHNSVTGASKSKGKGKGKNGF